MRNCPSTILNELGHGGSQDRKEGWSRRIEILLCYHGHLTLWVYLWNGSLHGIISSLLLSVCSQQKHYFEKMKLMCNLQKLGLNLIRKFQNLWWCKTIMYALLLFITVSLNWFGYVNCILVCGISDMQAFLLPWRAARLSRVLFIRFLSTVCLWTWNTCLTGDKVGNCCVTVRYPHCSHLAKQGKAAREKGKMTLWTSCQDPSIVCF